MYFLYRVLLLKCRVPDDVRDSPRKFSQRRVLVDEVLMDESGRLLCIGVWAVAECGTDAVAQESRV